MDPNSLQNNGRFFFFFGGGGWFWLLCLTVLLGSRYEYLEIRQGGCWRSDPRARVLLVSLGSLSKAKLKLLVPGDSDAFWFDMTFWL